VAVPLDAAEPAAAWRRAAERLRAGYWWDGEKLVGLGGARRYRDPSACLIKLTSGSTGEPRPLVFGGAQMLADARQVTRSMGIGPADRNYALIPFGHSYGLGNLSLPLLAHGVPVVCGTSPLPHAIADDFARWRPTVLPGVPAVFRALVAAAVAPAALASLRLAISAGAPLAVEVARDFVARFGRRLHGFYGSSETGGIAFDRAGHATLRGGVGTAMHGVEIVPLRAGRIRVGSAAVLTHGNPRRKRGLGWWVPPDRIAIDSRGRITVLGRRGATVKIAGRRINLGEVAARLRRLAGVGEVWVGVSAGSEPVLGAAVESARPAIDLRADLQADTAAWRIPKKWAVMPALPLSGRGKPDGRELRRQVFGER
jgi:acyl-coenzyme A synthetase/AMP-(fatty) acid ligase